MSLITLSVYRQWYMYSRVSMNVCLCHSETIRQFCPVSFTLYVRRVVTHSVYVLTDVCWRCVINTCFYKKCDVYVFGPMCVWDLRALYKSLIQVFDFKANGGSSGGWAGGKMLQPPSLLSGPCHVYVCISLFGIFLLSSSPSMIYCLFQFMFSW